MDVATDSSHSLVASTVARCTVMSVSSLRKKGHSLLEMQGTASESLQMVTDRPHVEVGHIVLVALPGSVLEDGRVARREKIAGEWSEGLIIDIVSNSPDPARSVPDDTTSESSEHESSSPNASVEYQVLPHGASSTDALDSRDVSGRLHFVNGDASKAQYGKGKKIITHVCNDMGLWGKGFVMAITDAWGKRPGKLYRQWHKAGAGAEFGLGRVQLVTLTDALDLANLVGQNGTKTGSKGPPVRYEAIALGLDAVCSWAVTHEASVHMPRIGSGLAGGEWEKIEAIIKGVIGQHDVDIYVYDYNG